MKYLLVLLALSATITSVNAKERGNISFAIIDNLRIDCSRAVEQYNFLEGERSTKSDKFKSSLYNRTLLGSLYAKFTKQDQWAYTTRSGLRDAVINLKQEQIREYCWGGNGVPTGY